MVDCGLTEMTASTTKSDKDQQDGDDDDHRSFRPALDMPKSSQFYKSCWFINNQIQSENFNFAWSMYVYEFNSVSIVCAERFKWTLVILWLELNFYMKEEE